MGYRLRALVMVGESSGGASALGNLPTAALVLGESSGQRNSTGGGAKAGRRRQLAKKGGGEI
jgi:hypothetical protein